MRHAVRVVADEGPAAWKDDESRAVLGDHTTHLQHAPGTSEDFLGAVVTAQYARVELAQHAAHLADASEERGARDELRVEALYRGADERHGCHRNEPSDTLEERVAERLDQSESLRLFEREQIGVAGEPRRKRNGCANDDRRAAVPLPPPREQPRDVPAHIAAHLPRLRPSRRAPSTRGGVELAEQRAILQHTVVVHRNRDDVQPRRERRIAPDAEHVVQQPDLRGAQLAVARQPALHEDALRHPLARDELHVALENSMVEWLAVSATDEVRAERLEHEFKREGACPFANGVRDRHLAGERVADEDVVGVGAMVHHVDEHRVARQAFSRPFVLEGD